MSKRNGEKFKRNPRDFYPTPLKAVPSLIPHLHAAGVKSFAEPCCGDGDLVRHLESFGLQCALASDIHNTGQDALTLTVADLNGADAVITNTPYKEPARSRIIRHLLVIAPQLWLLLPHDWAANKGTASLLAACSDIVVIGRVRWITGTHNDGYDNFNWYRFDPRHSSGPIFHARGVAPAADVCRQCRKPYQPQRSTARFCSDSCRQRAHRQRVSVTLT